MNIKGKCQTQLWFKIACAMLLTVLTACSKQVGSLSEGKQFDAFSIELADQSAQQPGIAHADIIEFFTYGCPHCKLFEPQLVKWHRNHADKKIVYVPVIWSPETGLYAKLFYLIRNREDFPRLNHDLFKLVSTFPATDSLDEIRSKVIHFLEQKGISQKDVIEALNTSKFDSLTASSITLMRRLKIDGTPTVVINHPAGNQQYKILNSALKSHDAIFSVMETLLNKS